VNAELLKVMRGRDALHCQDILAGVVALVREEGQEAYAVAWRDDVPAIDREKTEKIFDYWLENEISFGEAIGGFACIRVSLSAPHVEREVDDLLVAAREELAILTGPQ